MCYKQTQLQMCRPVEPHQIAFVPTGLDGGVKLLKGIADKYEDVTYADIFQLASAIAVKVLPSDPPLPR